MGTFKEIIQRMGEKGKARKELIRRMDEQLRMEKIVEDRQRSSNERELLRYQNEDREQLIKEHLEVARIKRQHSIDFEHQPLNAKNITKTEHEILKDPNIFSKKSDMFTNQNSIMHNNPNLLKTNKKLLQSNDKILKGGSMFKI